MNIKKFLPTASCFHVMLMIFTSTLPQYLVTSVLFISVFFTTPLFSQEKNLGLKVRDMQHRSFAEQPLDSSIAAGGKQLTEEQQKLLSEQIKTIKENSAAQQKALDELMKEGE